MINGERAVKSKEGRKERREAEIGREKGKEGIITIEEKSGIDREKESKTIKE